MINLQGSLKNVQYLVLLLDCWCATLPLLINVTSMTCFDRRKSLLSGNWVYVTAAPYCFTWKYLCDDEPLRSNHVAEVTFMKKKSDNAAQHQSTSMRKSCTSKTALANPITDQRNGMLKFKTSLVYILLLK